ncbi:MAG: MurT ligase domain-containing protein, partial [Acidimicrobiales bacterium]
MGTATANLSRRLGRGGGSVVGGRAILAMDPRALEELARARRVALVSGTNGKTTTTSLLASALSTSGPVVTNVLGANLPPGLAAALASAPAGVPAALEVDEAWLSRVVSSTHPAVVALLNLTRDQLDRNNEVRMLAASWRRTFAGDEASDATVVANADDPLVVWGASGSRRVTWVGAGQPWTADAGGCPGCGGRIDFPTGAGGWRCSSCDLARPALDVWLEGGVVVTSAGERFPLQMALPGRANQANAAMALCAARLMGVEPAAAVAAMGATTEVVGRYRTVAVNGLEVRLLLAKNPAGWLEVLDVLAPPPVLVVVAINSRIADGRDPSWLWDVPFEALRGRLVVASGERSRDLAVRLHYAEVDHRHEPDPLAAIRLAGDAAGVGKEVDVVGNYTAFQV